MIVRASCRLHYIYEVRIVVIITSAGFELEVTVKTLGNSNKFRRL